MKSRNFQSKRSSIYRFYEFLVTTQEKNNIEISNNFLLMYKHNEKRTQITDNIVKTSMMDYDCKRLKRIFNTKDNYGCVVCAILLYKMEYDMEMALTHFNQGTVVKFDE